MGLFWSGLGNGRLALPIGSCDEFDVFIMLVVPTQQHSLDLWRARLGKTC